MKVDLESYLLGIVGEDIFGNQSLARAGRHKQNCVVSVLHNRVIHLAIARKWKLDQPILLCIIDGRLE